MRGSRRKANDTLDERLLTVSVALASIIVGTIAVAFYANGHRAIATILVIIAIAGFVFSLVRKFARTKSG